MAKLFLKHPPDTVLFLDDLNVVEPEFTITGEVSMDRSAKLSQWIAAIDYAKSVNEQAYNTGDRRRIDVIKMGLLGLENFEVIGDTKDFLIEDQPIKTDEIQLNAQLNAQNAKAPEKPTGAPKKSKITQPQTGSSRMRQAAQPNNSGKNQSSKKNQ